MTADRPLGGPLEEWLDFVRQHSRDVVLDGPTNLVARGNMLSFSLDRAAADILPPEELVAFLEQAFQVYQRKLAPFPRPAWFYAWVDEMAGQLRLSAVACATPMDLPFGCALAPTSDPGLIARGFLSPPYLEGIPWSELTPVAPGTPDPPRPRHVLTVFARSLGPETPP